MSEQPAPVAGIAAGVLHGSGTVPASVKSDRLPEISGSPSDALPERIGLPEKALPETALPENLNPFIDAISGIDFSGMNEERIPETGWWFERSGSGKYTGRYAYRRRINPTTRKRESVKFDGSTRFEDMPAEWQSASIERARKRAERRENRGAKVVKRDPK